MLTPKRLDSGFSSESGEKYGDSSQYSKIKRKHRSSKHIDKKEEKGTKNHRKSKR